MLSDNIFNSENQQLLQKVRNDASNLQYTITQLYKECSTDISKSDVEEMDKLINKISQMAGWWILEGDEDNTTKT